MEQTLYLLDGGNVLLHAIGCGQVDHTGGVGLNDLVAFSIAEDSRHGGEIVLDRTLPDGLASAILSLAELGEHIFNGQRTQLA